LRRILTVVATLGLTVLCALPAGAGAPITVNFPATGGWSTIGSLTLNAGANTIRLTNPTAYAPDFDRITP
jgi:hypothetical protein